MIFRWRRFDELTTRELYDALHLRQEVFVVEQSCPYLDADGLDPLAHHLLGHDVDGALAGYLRVLPPGIAFPEWAIGRVVTAPQVRRGGFGRRLMEEGIAFVRAQAPAASIRIDAQSHLERFYAALGFRRDGEDHDLDGIPHAEMLLRGTEAGH